MTETDVFAATAARLLIGSYFAIGGANNLLNLSSAIEKAVAAGIPAATLTVFLVALLKTITGVLIVVKFHTKLASLVLIMYVLAASLLFYGPGSWSSNPPNEIVFMKNIAILGGLLSLYAHSRGLKMLRSGEAGRLARHVPKEQYEAQRLAEEARQ